MIAHVPVAAILAATALLGFAACGGGEGTDGGGLPTTPPPTPAPPPGEQIVLKLASSLVPASGAVRVVEGGVFFAEVRVLGLSPGSPLGGSEAGFQFAVVTDAPPDELRTPYAVTPRFPRIKVSGVARFAIEALPDGRTGEADAAYTIRLAPPAGGLPAGLTLADDALRVVVVDSPPVRCGGLDVTARFGGSEARRMRTGEITLAASHPDASVSMVHPYETKIDIDDFPHPPASSLFTTGFAATGTGDGFRATIPFRWTDFNRVELDARLPGCPPVTVRCDDGCSVR